MRRAHLHRLVFAALALAAAPLCAHAQDVTASAPVDLSVTVYRDPYRAQGGFDLNELNGFALITETRRVVIPPGLHRIRFEGVADGIEPASAIVTGLASGVIEKNRDAALISPSALVEYASENNGRILFTRADPAGRLTRREGTVRSGASGVVLETPDGIEALRCSGLPETVSFESSSTGLSATPTLSIQTRTSQRIETTVQLSYLARGFDWAADYTAGLAADGKKIDLGAWITLANGNGVSFRDARVQIVAGRLNKENGDIEPIDLGQPILAYCWPQGSTSDPVPPITIERAYPLGFEPGRYAYMRNGMPMPAPAASMAPESADRDNIIVTGSRRAEVEALGDLKLYRVPDRTMIASRQAKQVRFLDSENVPVARIYEADYYSGATTEFAPLDVILRTTNDKKNNLGVPLPSGRVSVFETVGRGAAAQQLLAGETGLRDLAANEETEIRLAGGAAVQSRHVVEVEERLAAPRPAPPFLPGRTLRPGYVWNSVNRVEISNSHPFPIQVEIRVEANDGEEVIRADIPVAQKNGRPIFRVTVLANDTYEFRYQMSERRP